MNWRRLRPGETDHEALWLGISLGGLAIAWFWLHFGLPLPRCLFHMLTGCACPTCGATRCVRFALGGDFSAALRMNPLVFSLLGMAAVYDAYAAAVLTFRLPRLRADNLPRWVGKKVRAAVLLALAANWAWLLWRGV